MGEGKKKMHGHVWFSQYKHVCESRGMLSANFELFGPVVRRRMAMVVMVFVMVVVVMVVMVVVVLVSESG
jgi:uncharacterized metal-binding protein